ncbi:ABC transporter substrate-binding protein [Cohnella yongneupensis]|uniref:ABC transporter substrate-binding protein n=1 Tax=Cohnella yongneupensis TaxID=425006 RepID=A0ABW0QXM7_9BACL
MNNRLTKLSCVMLIAGLLSACGSNNNANNASSESASPSPSSPAASSPAAEPSAEPSPDISGKITFLNHRTDIAETKMKDYVAEFKKLYPNADVEIEAVKDQSNILKVRAASGQLPDVTFVGGDSIQPKDYPKFFAPLDDLGLNDQVYFAGQSTIDGKLYAITSGGSITGMLYNKKAFATAGITAVPKTLDEFYAACEKLKAAGIVPVATNFKDKWPLNNYESLAQAIANDVNIMDKNAEIDTPFNTDQPYGKALDIFRTLAVKKYTEPDLFSTNWEQSKKDLATGKFAMALLGNWAIQQVIDNGAAPEDIGFFPMPVDNSGNLIAPIGSDAVLAVSKDSEHLDTAKAWVKFFVEKSGYDNDSGFVPAIKSKQSSLTQIAEFTGSGVSMIESGPRGDYANNVINKAQFAWPDLAQEYAVASDPQSVLDTYNKKWADTRKQVTK